MIQISALIQWNTHRTFNNSRVYATILAKRQSTWELFTFHLPPSRLLSPTSAADYFKANERIASAARPTLKGREIRI